jgi:hypothetical protein
MIQKLLTRYKVREYKGISAFEYGLKQMDGKGYNLESFAVYVHELNLPIYCAVFSQLEVVDVPVIGGDWQENEELLKRLNDK